MNDTLWQDLRHAGRSLRRRPLVTAVAVFSLALGVGVNTAMFSVLNRVLLAALPVPSPKELVALSTKHGILTPYTSFLADENAPAQQLADVRAHYDLAARAVDRLEATDGVAGVAQRDAKKALQEAAQAPAARGGAFGAGGAGDGRDATAATGAPGPRAANVAAVSSSEISASLRAG